MRILSVSRLRYALSALKRRPGCGRASLRQFSTTPAPPILSVSPSRALVDEKLKVRVENLPPGLPVTLRSLHLSEDNDYWEAYGHYVSDHRGVVSVPDDLSFGGTYTGKEAMGLLWSMRPVSGSCDDRRQRTSNVCSPLLVNFSVYSGHEAEGLRERTPLASALVERWYVAPGVRRIEVREKGVRGTLFMPPGPGPFPGLLDLWGGGGGLVEYRASLLASRGYAALALDYLDSGRMLSADVEVEYFENAFNVLRDYPRVISDKIGLLSLSLGSIVTIFLLAESAVVKPVCAVCISAVNIYLHGGNLGAVSDLIAMNADKIRVNQDEHQTWKEMTRHILSHPSNVVDGGKISCPLLLVNGSDDQNLITVECAERMSRRMTAVGKEHLLTALLYPDAGHLIEPPYSPHFRVTKFNKNIKMMWGGKTKPHSDAQEDAWWKILAYLQHHLYSTPRGRT